MFNITPVINMPMDGLLPDHGFGKWLIEREPMLFQSNIEFAEQAGGPITKSILDILRSCISSQAYDRLRIDTRSHMLMPGWYPSIPGWHCDFLETDESGNQVMSIRDDEIIHYMFLSGGPSTEFLSERNVDIPELDYYKFKWGEVSKYISNTDNIEKIIYQIPSGQIIKFNARELHRATPWKGAPNHWRFFFRATDIPGWHKDYGKYSNKIRSQVQVYADLNEGW